MILSIGSGTGAIDVSDYVEVGYNVSTQQLVSNQWTGINGSEHQTVLGKKYTLSCELGHVPSTTASSICTLLESASVSMTFSSPVTTTATFIAPSYTATLITETGLWDISINATSEPQLNSL